jgi:hypothetical protein
LQLGDPDHAASDMAPVRAAKTVVKTFVTDGDCAQLG